MESLVDFGYLSRASAMSLDIISITSRAAIHSLDGSGGMAINGGSNHGLCPKRNWKGL